MNKKIIILIVGALLVFIIGGFLWWRASQPKSLEKITYGWNVWPGVLPYLVAKDQGFFKDNGLDVEMVEYDSYIKKVDDAVSGKINFSGDFALIDVIEKVSKGNALQVVLATDYSNGADGIVAKSEIKNISELKNKNVAVEMGTLGEYLLYDALKKNNLTLSDINEVNLTAQEAAQVFIRGEVDAAVTYEPDYSEAVKKGNGTRIYTSADSPGLIIDCLTFRKDFLIQNPLKVQAVVNAYFEAMDFISLNPDKAYAIGAKYFKITPDEYKEQIKGVKLMSKDDNLKAFTYGSGIDSLHGTIKNINNFLIGKGTIKTVVDSTEVINPTFIREER